MRKAQESTTPFNLKFIKQSTGELITAENVTQTSSSHARRTRNIRFTESGEIRTVRNISIVGFNGVEVYV